jgi:hypothetical protein
MMASEKSGTNWPRLTLAAAAVKRLVEADIRCTPDVSLEYQRAAGKYVLRGRESGGAVKGLGRYVSFCGDDGTQLAWFMRPDSPVANGDHAIVIAPSLVSIEMFRFERTYELLIARYTIQQAEKRKRPTVSARLIFRGWQGQLPLDLVERDKALAGSIAPEFFERSGEPRQIPEAFVAAVHAVTAAVNCLECRHAHFLVAKPAAAATTAASTPAMGTVAAEATVLQQDSAVDDQHAPIAVAAG